MNNLRIRFIAGVVATAVLIAGIALFAWQYSEDGISVAVAEQEEEDVQPDSPNCAPHFDAGGAVEIEVDEHTAAGTNVGEPISATDPEGGELSYSLVGQDKDAFALDAATGQLTTKAETELDHETKAAYSFYVLASDESGDASCILVQVSVVDNSYTHEHKTTTTRCRRTRVDGGCDRRFRPATITTTVVTCPTHRHDGSEPKHSTGPCHE